jgi:hypothetical protein
MYPSSGFCGEGDADSAEAEVDHGCEVVGVGMAVTAPVDESDFGVDSFKSAVGEAVFDRGDDSLEVAADDTGEVVERLESAPFSRPAPGLQVGGGVVRFDDPVEVSETFFQFPGSPKGVAGAA